MKSRPTEDSPPRTSDTSDAPTRARVSSGQGRLSVAWHQTFSESLRKCPNVAAACLRVNVSRGTAYLHRKQYQKFCDAWDEALAEGLDNLEAACFHYATYGIPKKKFTNKGEPIVDPETGEQYVETEYPVALMCFLLKSHRRETYGDKVEMTGNNKPMSAEEIQRKLDLAKAGLISTIRGSLGYSDHVKDTGQERPLLSSLL